VILCFDEVKTGFRFAMGGFQQYCGITPDLSCFGKAIGNGYDISFVCGRREIMETVGDVWIAATFNGHFVSAAAALATIEEMEKHDGIQTIWRQGEKLQKGLDEIMKAHGVDARPVGLGPMPHPAFGPGNEELRDQFYTEAAANGVYFSPGHVWFISLSHDDEAIQQTLDASEKAIKKALR
ncbi:MAG: aminotransferase class III-fold pyridoxal phosphate-dependent enzyme, partial [Armatimonadetes bacterium]|nr:aminotransferase class III-fold pyridoxal phosphate-dependent enzyme [Armatimonadota bacterium]